MKSYKYLIIDAQPRLTISHVVAWGLLTPTTDKLSTIHTGKTRYEVLRFCRHGLLLDYHPSHWSS